MKIQHQYNFYDLSAVKRGLPIEVLNDEYTIISTCSLQYIDNSIEDIDLPIKEKYRLLSKNKYRINKDIYQVILYNNNILEKENIKRKNFDWVRPEMKDLACAAWANDSYCIDNLVYHTCSLEMYNYAQCFFGKDSIILH